jgi:hypothetical protein
VLCSILCCVLCNGWFTQDSLDPLAVKVILWLFLEILPHTFSFSCSLSPASSVSHPLKPMPCHTTQRHTTACSLLTERWSGGRRHHGGRDHRRSLEHADGRIRRSEPDPPLTPHQLLLCAGIHPALGTLYVGQRIVGSPSGLSHQHGLPTVGRGPQELGNEHVSVL